MFKLGNNITILSKKENEEKNELLNKWKECASEYLKDDNFFNIDKLKDFYYANEEVMFSNYFSKDTKERFKELDNALTNEIYEKNFYLDPEVKNYKAKELDKYRLDTLDAILNTKLIKEETLLQANMPNEEDYKRIEKEKEKIEAEECKNIEKELCELKNPIGDTFVKEEKNDKEIIYEFKKFKITLDKKTLEMEFDKNRNVEVCYSDIKKLENLLKNDEIDMTKRGYKGCEVIDEKTVEFTSIMPRDYNPKEYPPKTCPKAIAQVSKEMDKLAKEKVEELEERLSSLDEPNKNIEREH